HRVRVCVEFTIVPHKVEGVASNDLIGAQFLKPGHQLWRLIECLEQFAVRARHDFSANAFKFSLDLSGHRLLHSFRGQTLKGLDSESVIRRCHADKRTVETLAVPDAAPQNSSVACLVRANHAMAE